ncbi:MAG TPA: histidine phosphatase family protein [Candidatus Paceibacterota bacterium]|nr:histidine phosphatase family protein [Candidatus Paceibacterota bacterium]
MKKEFRYIYLFRHGQTEYNKKRIFTGLKESKLTPLGVKQAKLIARKLKNKKIDIAYQTKLSRSKDTLKEVIKFHPECKKVIIDNRMIERNYGKLNGIQHKDYVKKYGQEKFDLIHRGFNVKPPAGESFVMIEKRVESFIKDLTKKIKKEKVNVMISSHGNSIRIFRKIMEHSSVKETTSWFIPYDKVFVYKIRV